MAKIQTNDTIAAVATPPGEGGIAVIRVSGPEAFEVAGRVVFLTSGKSMADVPSHTVHLGRICNEEGRLIDQALVSLFVGPHSYTAENVAEISVHGGLAVARRTLELIFKHGARPAEPGEFTKRAFLNGKIDLAQAEAVLDLIKAKSERSLECAASQLAGVLSAEFQKIKGDMMIMYAHMEAFLDFPEEDIEIYSDQDFAEGFSKILSKIERLIASFKRGAILREGVMAVIAGKPNVGKSSLFNALLERDRALVSEYSGTTRDRLEESVEIGGITIRLIDTAGLVPDAEHPLVRMSGEKTKQTLSEADVFLFTVDGSAALEEADRMAFKALDPQKPVLVIVNKSDLKLRMDLGELKDLTGQKEWFEISAQTREGLEALEKKMVSRLLKENLETEGAQVTRLRHKHALEKALKALRRAREAYGRREPLEIVTLDFRAALDEMRELVGEVYSEDLLGVIFSEFCIGK